MLDQSPKLHRQLGRGIRLALATALFTVAAASSCTHANLATMDVDNGAGGLVTASPVVYDSAVPGGKYAQLQVTATTFAPLKAMIAPLLDPSSVAGNAALLLNSTTPPSFLCTDTGPHSVCLTFARNLNAPPLSDDISLLPGLPEIDIDPQLVTFPGLDPNDDLPLTSLQGLTIPLTPTGTEGLFLLGTLVPAANAQLDLRLDPSQLAPRSVNGRAGLWMPATLVNRNPEIVDLFCEDQDGTAGLDCERIMAEINDSIEAESGLNLDCHRIDVSVRLKQVRFWLGLVPEITPDCLPFSVTNDGAANLEWMENSFIGKRYVQPCMRMGFRVETVVDAEPFTGNLNADLLFSVGFSDCDLGIDVACGLPPNPLLDCGEKATDKAEENLEQQIRELAGGPITEQVAPLFTYPGGWPYYFPPAAPCDAMDPGCRALIRNHLLPGSLTSLAYSWFASPFSSFDTTPPFHYPVFEVEPSCPPYTGVGSPPDGGPDLCIQCLTPGCHYSADERWCVPDSVPYWPCVPSDSFPVTAFNMKYAVDPDNDGLAAWQGDNCPTKPNTDPTAYQLDSDGDGYGNACDECPCSLIGDVDQDSFCACDSTLPGCAACSNLPADNCPTVWNTSQFNCNLDAELAAGYDHVADAGTHVLGDACDPVPCADGDKDFEPLRVSFAGNYANGACTPQATPEENENNCPISIDTRLQWRGVMVPGSSEGTTEIAHCRCNEPHITAWDRVANCQQYYGGLPRCPLHDGNVFPAQGSPPPFGNWRAITTTYPDPTTFIEVSGRNHSYQSTYTSPAVPQPLQAASWRFDLDLDPVTGAYADLGIVLPTGIQNVWDLDPVLIPLNGVGWLKTRALNGTPLTGETNNLASHFFDNDLDAGIQADASFLDLQYKSAFFDDPICFSCPFSLGLGPVVVSPVDVFWVAPVDAQNVRTSPPSKNFARSVGSALSGPLQQALSQIGSAFLFVAPAEPAASLRARGMQLRGLLVDRATGVPAHLLMEEGGSLSVADSAPCERECGNLGLPENLRALSAAKDELYVLVQDAGQVSLATWNLSTGALSQHPIEGVVTSPSTRSLAYREADDSLYLVDLLVENGEQWMRIVQILRSGFARERLRVALPVAPASMALHIATANNGMLVLAVSGVSELSTPLYVQFDPGLDPGRDHSALTMEGWGYDSNRGGLLLPPETRGRTGMTVGVRAPNGTLRFQTVPWYILSQQPSGTLSELILQAASN